MAVATTPSTTNTDPYTIDIINLNNLLTRLEQNILTSSSSAEYKLLQQSHLHRARIGANIDYAQTLLNNIDRSLPAVKSPATRHERTTDLAKKRARWVNVKERFDLVVEDIERRSHEYNDDDVNEEEEEEVEDDGIWEGINPVSERKSDAEVVAEAEVEADVQTENDNIIPEQTTTTLRQRHGHDTTTTTTTTTPSTTTTTTAAITASGTSTLPKPSPATKTTIATKPELESPNNTKEATLSTHRAEQESLTTSLLTLAGQLKASSEAFQASLEHEKGILNRAVEGLDRNISGMDAAGKRMGVLRRMSEGRGWWGRMMMYLWIFGLWIVALAIVYLGPKLRF